MAARTMTNTKICPLCKKENSDDAAICINCGFDLNPTFTADQHKHADWLSTFRSDSEDESGSSDQENTAKGFTDELDNESPDWLERIRDRKQQDDEFESVQGLEKPENKKSTNSKGTDELVDSLRMDNIDQIDNEEGSNDLINILRNAQDDDFREDQLEKSSIPELNDTEESDDLPINEDWIARFTQPSDIPATEIQETPLKDKKKIPEWIQDNEITHQREKEINEEQKSPFTDWVEKFGNTDELTSDVNYEKKLPDWIQTSADGEEVEAGEVPTIPTWLGTEDTAEQVDSDGAEISKVPGWVNEIDKKASIADEISADEILPDWMTEESPSTDEMTNLSRDQGEPSVESIPSKSLNKLSRESQIQKASSKPGKSTANKRKVEKSESAEIKSQPPAEITAPPFQLDQVPNWLENNEDLINTGFFEDKEVKEGESTEPSRAIEPGELPSWLKAMRPLEAIVPTINVSTEKKQIERSGPLAGLKGVLSSQDTSQVYSPPPMYASILNITDKQKIQADILDKLFSEEKQSISKSDHERINWQDIALRILIPIILLGCIVYTLFLNPGSTPRPAIFPTETVRFATLVNGLILNSEAAPNILLIMESDGASQAELSLLTKNVFERLMVKDSFISIISSSPNGALLASNLIQNAASQMSVYDLTTKVTNLGYLAGGSTGIQNFLSDPRWTMPSGIGNSSVWDSDGLSNITNVSQFNAIFMITDDNENSKYWLEQLQVFSPESIVLVAATTQSIPMLNPYVESSQIDGMIGGLYGGASYAELNQSDNADIWKFWEIQKFVIYLFILIIIAGGLLFLVQVLFKRPSGENVTR